MYLEFSQIFQLSAGLIGAILIMVAASAAPMRVSVGILLFMIPFQPIETRFGSANVLMTFVLFGALLLRGRLRYVPMLGPMLLLVFAYLVSIGQLHPGLYFEHGLHLFFIISGLLVFVLAYNLAREVDGPRYLVNLLVGANILAVIYCLVQFSVGPGERMTFFGMSDLWMHRNRGAGDSRLVGPFGTPGITAAYFMSMTVMLAYEILHSRKYRRVALSILAAANVAMIMATANRGSFLVLIASMIGFLFLFRRELGVVRAINILVAGMVIVAGTGALVTTHTEFGNMFNRLERVAEFEGGVPQTRRGVWPAALETIPDKLWFGHGPVLAQRTAIARSGRDVHPEQLVMSYPHNLYLHLLLTLGIFGTACMLFFLLATAWRIHTATRTGSFENTYQKGFVSLGVLIIAGFFVDQIKIEFVRHSTIDYVHFVFALFGMFLGLADAGRARALQSGQVESETPELGPDEPLPAALSMGPRVGTDKNRAGKSEWLAGS
jgi:O-antigen ligase